jgi:hypothetical protein
MSLKNIEKYVDTLIPSAKKNLKILSKEDLGQDFVLHLSMRNMDKKEYIPFISKRQANDEDNTILRVTTSDNLLGCIIGFATLLGLSLYDNNPEFRQGLYIEKLEFDYLLKPNNRLVFDASQSNELWLVPYDDNHRGYIAETIGIIFIKRVTIEPIMNKETKTIERRKQIELYVKVTNEDGIKFSKRKFLNKGFYRVTMPYSYYMKYTDDKDIYIEPIEKKEFLDQKKISAAFLDISSRNSLMEWV